MENLYQKWMVTLSIIALLNAMQLPVALAANNDLPEAAVIAPPPFPNPNIKQTAESNEGIVEITPEMAEQINTASNNQSIQVNPAMNEKPASTETPAPQQAAVIKKTIAKRNPIKSKELVKLKQTAWVVQMGSFKDKNNARRLVDALRKAGYKAFSEANSKQTRVYIGPEFKQTTASQLSASIEHQLSMHGIVVAYHPLDL